MTQNLSDAEGRERLWDTVEDHHTGMLGLEGSHQHFQPMTAFVERDTDTIWFFTRNDSDLVQAIGAGAQANFIFTDRKLQACIDGRISLAHDRDRIERYWNVHVAAWYPEGKDD